MHDPHGGLKQRLRGLQYADTSLMGLRGLGAIPTLQPAPVPPVPPTPPAVPRYYVEFDGATSFINCGSDASLDDLPSTTSFTMDMWARLHTAVPAPGTPLNELISKFYGPSLAGWRFGLFCFVANTAIIEVEVYGDVPAYFDTVESVTINTWHHYTFYWDMATGTPYAAIDGNWCTYTFRDLLVSYYSDVANSLILGRRRSTNPQGWLDGDISWTRISSGDRFGVGVNFTPPVRCIPPAVDGTTIELWIMDEGVGVTTAASVVTPANDGAMTNCIWHDCI